MTTRAPMVLKTARLVKRGIPFLFAAGKRDAILQVTILHMDFYLIGAKCLLNHIKSYFEIVLLLNSDTVFTDLRPVGRFATRYLGRH